MMSFDNGLLVNNEFGFIVSISASPDTVHINNVYHTLLANWIIQRCFIYDFIVGMLIVKQIYVIFYDTLCQIQQ